MAQDEQASGGNQGGQDRIIQQLLGEGGGAAAGVLFAVGRIGENQVKLLTLRGQLGQGGGGVLHPQVEPAGGKPGQLEVLPDELGVPAGFLHADGMDGAAAQAFQAQGAGAAK